MQKLTRLQACKKIRHSALKKRFFGVSVFDCELFLLHKFGKKQLCCIFSNTNYTAAYGIKISAFQVLRFLRNHYPRQLDETSV